MAREHTDALAPLVDTIYVDDMTIDFVPIGNGSLSAAVSTPLAVEAPPSPPEESQAVVTAAGLAALTGASR